MSEIKISTNMYDLRTNIRQIQSVLNDLDENSATNFLAEKELYIVSNNKILELNEFKNNETLKFLFDSIYQKIENQFELKHVIQFQKRFEHITN